MSDVKTTTPTLKLSNKHRAFVDEYFRHNMNATDAYCAVYPNASRDSSRAMAAKLLTKVNIQQEITKRLKDKSMGADEVIARLSGMARASTKPFIRITNEGFVYFDFSNPEAQEYLYLIKKIKTKRSRRIDGKGKAATEWEDEWVEVELYDSQAALEKIGKYHKLFVEKEDAPASTEDRVFSLPADLIAPSFVNVYRDTRDRKHMEYLLKGGRGSTKSSFTSLDIIYLLVNHPTIHALAMRKVADTLRTSVYSQLVWAINEMGLSDQFKCTVSPLEVTYKPTGQKVYFHGADEPEKLKSIKPPFGHIAILWLEELDQFAGPEAIRKIEQSVIRGGEEAWEFKTYNPPRTVANWVNKYVQIPKANQYQHHSTYLDVPVEWLGKTFVEEAEHLKNVNPKAYEHEYLGIANGTGGLVFENVQVRKITDEEVSQFDRVLQGADWGYYPDPFAWVKCHYDAARMTLYIFDELRMQKAGNKETYEALVRTKQLTADEIIIADSAEPKSVADYRQYASDGIQDIDENGNSKLDKKGKPILLYGPSCKGAEKGPESVKYSMKWLQSLKAIVIDNKRCPHSTEEFLNYELEQDKDGDFISEYSDKNNHFIDAVRYATNLIWRRRGQ